MFGRSESLARYMLRLLFRLMLRGHVTIIYDPEPTTEVAASLALPVILRQRGEMQHIQ